MYRVISPKKILERRGSQTRKVISDRSDGKISEQELYAYENGVYRPSDKKLPFLLKGLNCLYEDITEPVELIAA